MIESKTTPIMAEMFDVVRQALNKEYAALLPEGGEITRIDLYDPYQHKAPHLWIDKCQNPAKKYIATITYNTGCGSMIGETVNDAVKATIAKIGEYHGTKN